MPPYIYSRMCVLTQRAPLNVEISRGFRVPWRSNKKFEQGTREKEKGRKSERPTRKAKPRGEQKYRTATTATGVIARKRHGPRESASGPPNNSPRTRRATCTCHGVATRASVSLLLERRELRGFIPPPPFFITRKQDDTPNAETGRDPARPGGVSRGFAL